MTAVVTSPAIERGRAVLRMEREAIAEAERRLDDRFARAIELIAAAAGRVIVTGVGKSGIVGRKIAATLTSTGTPATFVHPVESVHGDLGIVSADDVAILISKSGETQELLPLLEHLKRHGVRVVGFTGTPDSTLGRHADVVIDTWVREEACPHDLAPTTSTTVALALGDALAVVLLERKAFRREDFARLHPGGALGRQLLTRVSDVMVTSPLPALPPNAPMREAVVQMAERRGTVAIVDDQHRVLGVVTAGDLTRLMERERDFMDVRVDTIMTRTPKVARDTELGSAVVYRMQQHGIMAMPVVDQGEHLVGMVHLHDLMRAGVV
ncbi:MAG TPA: KpsF/GutQ family sugar-phosphate isomerase [Gemmatimonadaceae bacterium]|nr:KpsF/GutQ family sugar-phosphate isomerase [Gemmatimonadaceae bacterium]